MFQREEAFMLHDLVVDQHAVANSLRYMSQSEVLRTREREFCFLGAAITYLVTVRQSSLISADFLCRPLARL